MINLGRVKYATQNHTQEMLYIIANGEELFVSNSAAFLLAKTDNALDVDYYHYEEDFCSGLFGLSKAKK